MKTIHIIGAGLAGSEAAYQIAKRGYKVKLYEMRPNEKAKAHHTSLFSELVCSNSLKSNSLENAAGLLKEEMRQLDSLIINSADLNSVPAGQALAVDRDLFAQYITDKIKSFPNIEIVNEEVKKIPTDEIVIVASGPLTSDDLFEDIKNYVGNDDLYFYDAAAPLISKDCIDMNIAYYKSRYDHGTSDYINCPFEKDEFFNFYYELIKGERVELHNFEKEIHFEACMPIEAIAMKGFKTLTFGPMKPVGLEKDENTRRPFAVVQLRQDNVNADLYNIVGFQTNLKFGEQKRIFSMIPGLKNINIVRYGVMHRNTYINSPKCLSINLNLNEYPNIFFAGQITGVEGYVESAACGIVAGINAIRYIENKELIPLPKETVLGSLLYYISHASNKHFQPMNANYGIIQSLEKDKNKIKDTSLLELEKWKNKL